MIIYVVSNMRPHDIHNYRNWIFSNSGIYENFARSEDAARALRTPNRREYTHRFQLERLP